jgi:hypothetical protein
MQKIKIKGGFLSPLNTHHHTTTHTASHSFTHSLIPHSHAHILPPATPPSHHYLFTLFPSCAIASASASVSSTLPIIMFLHRSLIGCRRVSRYATMKPPATILNRSMSTVQPENENEDKTVAYIGTFGGTLKLLRRVSLCSATLSITSLPMMMVLNGTAPSLPQLIVIGTAVTASLGSTMFLKLMSFPYVTKFEEIPPVSDNQDFLDRRFMAYRISMLGMEYGTEVQMRDVESVKVIVIMFLTLCSILCFVTISLLH